MAEYYREMKRIEKEKKEEEIAYYAELAKQEENEIEYYLNLIQDGLRREDQWIQNQR